MNMGLDLPLQVQLMRCDISDDLISMIICDPSRRVINIHNAIDHGTGVGIGILDHIANRVGGRVEEGFNLGG
jgi:hypothetical protein